MPYIESNQDVSSNDLFNKALMVGAVAIGAAAMGQMAFKSIAEKWGSGFGKMTEGKQVLKGLYGKEAGNIQKGIADIVPMPEHVADGPQYKLINNAKNKTARFERTDGSAWQRFKSNKLSPTWSAGDGWASKFIKPADKDLAMFNRSLKDLHAGKEAGFSKSKLSMYSNIVDNAENHNINITGKDAVNATNHSYASDKNFYNRKNAGINNMADDVDVTNELWGQALTKKASKPNEASTQSEITKRANAERDAQTYQDLYSKESGVIPNTNRTGKLRDNYENFWKNADLDNVEKRNPGTYNLTDARRDAANSQRQEINERIAEQQVLKNANVSTTPSILDAGSKKDYADWWGGNVSESDMYLGRPADQKHVVDTTQLFPGNTR